MQKTSSKSKSSVLTDCSELDSEIILSECRIVGALEGNRLELGVRLVTLQLYTLILVQYSSSELQELQVLATGTGLLNAGKSLETRTNASKPWASLPHSRNTCCIKLHLYSAKGWATRRVCVPRLQLETAAS